MAFGPTTWRPWSPRGSPERSVRERPRAVSTSKRTALSASPWTDTCSGRAPLRQARLLRLPLSNPVGGWQCLVRVSAPVATRAVEETVPAWLLDRSALRRHYGSHRAVRAPGRAWLVIMFSPVRFRYPRSSYRARLPYCSGRLEELRQ